MVSLSTSTTARTQSKSNEIYELRKSNKYPDNPLFVRFV